MSLYSGIKFGNGQSDPTVATSATPSSSISTRVDEPSTSASPSASPANIESSKPALAKPAGEWSTALKFAPRIPKAKPITAPPRPAGFSTTTYSAVPTVIEAKADIVRSAEPQLKVEDEVVLGPDGKPLARAPAMTLGAGGEKRGPAKGKKGAKREWARGRGPGEGAKKKKKKKKNNQPVLPSFDPEEQYDPNKPNDLGEYQDYRKKLREEKRAALIEEKRRRAAGEGSSGEGSSYYTESEDEVAPRRDAPKMFAPPKMYNPPPTSTPPTLFHAPPLPPDTSGDHPYARRAAPAQAATGEDAYARRAAIAQAATGDDAYARRLALSQGQAAPPPAPSSVPAPPPSFAPPAPPPSLGYAPPPAFTSAPSSSFTPLPPPSFAEPPHPSGPPLPPPPSDIPGFGAYHAPPVPAPVPPPASEPDKDDFAKMLEERRKAAEAIAAKFKNLVGAGPSAPAAPLPAPPMEDQSGTFAEKMMRRWGHKEGAGLGAHGTGIVHALTAEHVTASQKPGDPSQPMSKRQLAKQKAAAANAKNRKWTQTATSRGRIVNANEDERQREEKGRLGEASRVVCLVGLVEGLDDVDEDLSDEIGEECSKWGIVERVVLHMVEPQPPEPPECLRVFVVFSGMAGAWRATRELDGRFFGGKKIRATYFDEKRFDAGERDGALI